MKPAVLSNAAGVIVGHNHSSGNLEPSQEDIQVTRKLVYLDLSSHREQNHLFTVSHNRL